MSKAHRGKGIRELPARGRGGMPCLQKNEYQGSVRTRDKRREGQNL